MEVGAQQTSLNDCDFQWSSPCSVWMVYDLGWLQKSATIAGCQLFLRCTLTTSPGQSGTRGAACLS